MARRRRLFLTPDSTTGGELCRPLIIPLALLPSFGGALAQLTESQSWEQFGSVTPDEAAEACTVILTNWYGGECGEGGEPCVCEFPPDIELGIDFNIRIIRRTSTGGIEVLVDGVWEEPTGELEPPEVPAREEADAIDRQCLAAANAANVLAELYEEITDQWSIEHTKAAVFGAILDAVITLMGAFGQMTAASYVSFGKTAFDAFVESVDTLASDVWDSNFTDELSCFLYNESTDTAGVVTFDWAELRAQITDKFLEAGGALDTDRALLWGQVGYLFDVLGSDGINMGGTTTAVAEYDCDDCGNWCYEFDFAQDNGGFSIDIINGFNAGFYLGDNYWYSRDFQTSNPPGTGFSRMVSINKNITESATVTRVTVWMDYTAGSFAGAVSRYQLRVGGTLLENLSTSPATGTNVTRVWNGSTPLTGILSVWLRSSNQGTASYSGVARIRKIRLEGPGANPLGLDNC